MSEPHARAAAFVLLLALLPAAASAQQAWSVEDPGGPTRVLEYVASEGTWMSLDVSPDGRTLVFDLLGHLYEMPVAGGDAIRLTDGRSWNVFPRYSPDGGRIAFTSDRGGSHDVWVLDRASGRVENLSRSEHNVARPSWARDGRTVYAGLSGDGVASALLALSRDGAPTVLAGGPGAVDFAAPAPDGSALYVERRAGGLYPFQFNPYAIVPGGARIDRVDPVTGEAFAYIERPGGAFNPAVSPDGARLAYMNRDAGGTVLLVQDVATRGERVLLRGLDLDRQEGGSFAGPYPGIAWHPDGRRLFVWFGGGIHSVDVATGRATRVPFRAPVDRTLTETLRFTTDVPEETARTRMARWGGRTPMGVLFEALGDLWIENDGRFRNLTDSPAHETSPVYDAGAGTLYYAAWTDDELGGVYSLSLTAEVEDEGEGEAQLGGDAPGTGTAGRGAGAAGGSPVAVGRRERPTSASVAAVLSAPSKLTSVPSQYGSLALSRDGARLAYVRGAGALQRGLWLSNETDFELVVRERDGCERTVTRIEGRPLEYANIAAKIPPHVSFTADGRQLLFTEFVRDTLVLKRIATDGTGERTLVRFPHAVDAVPSPDGEWIAVREYHRSFLTPFDAAAAGAGEAPVISAFDGQGVTLRVDAEDGGYLRWSADGRTLEWTRAAGFYEKDVARITAEDERGGLTSGQRAAGPEDWTGERVPGSTARRTDLAVTFDVDAPGTVVALTNARVITMNAGREVLEDATVLVRGHEIAAVGRDVAVPQGARVFDLAGHTVMPGIVDAHAHPHIDHSPLHVIEQRPPYFHGALAYGVTTMVEVYGNEYRDGWFSDMIRAGKITGPRFYTTGSVIYGRRFGSRPRMYRPFDDLAGALEQVRWNKDHGALAVKDYAQSTRRRRHLTMMAARVLGVNVVSESSGDPQMNLTQIMDGGTGIEHSMGLATFYDDVVRFWGATEAGMTPTLGVAYGGHMGEGWFHQKGALWEDEKLTRFILPEQLMRLRRTAHVWPEDYWAREMAAGVKRLWDRGTSIQLGAHGQMLGLATHWELQILVDGGFTPAEALEIGTIRGAAYHGLDASIGSLEPGKLADLLVLRSSPLDDIANTQDIRWVMKHGVLYSGEDASRVYPEPRPAGEMYFRRATTE